MELMNTKWQGEGWYGIRAWDNDLNEWVWAEEAPAIWIENEYMFCLETNNVSRKPEHQSIVFAATYYGNDELPDEPVLIADSFIETLSDKAKAAYFSRTVSSLYERL